MGTRFRCEVHCEGVIIHCSNQAHPEPGCVRPEHSWTQDHVRHHPPWTLILWTGPLRKETSSNKDWHRNRVHRLNSWLTTADPNRRQWLTTSCHITWSPLHFHINTRCLHPSMWSLYLHKLLTWIYCHCSLCSYHRGSCLLLYVANKTENGFYKTF